MFTHGHTLQLGSVLRIHLIRLVQQTDLLAGIGEQAFIDVDSALRPTFGHAKQGPSYGHTKIAGRQVLRKGLSPLATTISTRTGAPVVAGSGSAPVRPARARTSTARSPFVSSCRVAEIAGFGLEGRLRQSYRYPDGVYHDEHLHARLASDRDAG